MKYLLDTNVCIRILKGSSPEIYQRISNIENSCIVIPSIVRFELFYGAFKSLYSEKTLNTLKAFLGFFDTVSFDNKAAMICGRIRTDLEKIGRPIGPYDLLIASTAMANNLILVTHNVKEFSRVKGLLFEDWEVPGHK